MTDRIQAEISHWKQVAGHAERVWGWEGSVGRRRALRRAGLLVEAAGLHPGVLALELGCGTGVFTALARTSGADITAIDLCQDLLDMARSKSPSAMARFIVGNIEAMPFHEGAFDAIYGSSVLHHLDVRVALLEILRVLKPGGRLACVEPNLLNPHVMLIKKIKAIGSRVGELPHETAFVRWKVAHELERAGFRQVSVRPVDFLHPAIPGQWAHRVERVGRALEDMPMMREIAGSLLIVGMKA